MPNGEEQNEETIWENSQPKNWIKGENTASGCCIICASSVEELSVTVTKIADQAVDNSNHVQAATEYVSQAVLGVRRK